MAEVTDIPVPRYDFYQTDSHVILSLYVKGYGTPELKDQVAAQFEPSKVSLTVPDLAGGSTKLKITLGPLFGRIQPEGSSARALSSKVELKLAKADHLQWSSVLGDGTLHTQSTSTYQPPASTSAQPLKKERRNWDKLLDSELQEEKSKDPNAGGDAALKDFFSKLYADADEDTKRAMIKSYTESGGTTLSTNWSEIGKETTPIRPPDGMEARRY